MTTKKKKRKSQGFAGGYLGKILRINLSKGKISEETLPDADILRKYIGCWGLGLRYLYDMVPPGINVTDAENPLIFMNGPLTGLPLPGATNITLATKNFNTGFTVGRSHTHGTFAILLKAAGYDGVIVTGKSEKPVYLWIHNGKSELRDASHLWGQKDSHDTEDVIKEEVGKVDAGVAAIGPAGENLCAGAMICNDKNHSFSHSGVGSVMGSKKLKAIAVFGDQPIPVADSAKVKLMRGEWIKQMRLPGHFGWHVLRSESLKVTGDYRERATKSGFVGKNFLENQLTEFGIGLSKQEYIRKPCPNCPIACTYDIKVTTGPFAGYHATSGPGGEPFEGSGAILRITEPGSYIYLADLYDRLGIECSMAGCTMAMAIEAYEKGLITKEDTDGLELKWGDIRVAEALLRKMVHSEGFGKTLALGMKRAAEIIGGDAPSFAVNIKGSAMNLHDWRSAWGILFSQIVGSGAGWTATGADYFTPEPDAGFPELTDRFDIRTKPMEAKMTGIIKFMNDCSGLCMLNTWGTKDVLRLTAESINAATGWELTSEDMFEVGFRLMHLERAFNVRHGLKPEDDWTATPRLVDPPLDGPAKGKSIKPHLVGMVKEYYRLMGWDEITGKPWRSTLKNAGLEDVIKDLWG
jgi:aldehyde:ferredoxin oxidoreductase